MNGRKIFGIIVAIIVFFGLGTVIALLAGESAGNPIIRLVGLFICFVVASVVYNLMKGEEPEIEIKEKHGVTSEEISKKLEEKRKRTQ
ncbi:MAG: hypothetical protein HZC47_08865 [Methanobacterium sp.]|uniref:hypothetical protein n=1 Tax=Methanobacterium sp. TaxID=2164 RepID=UPI003D64C5E7|nr:hypothetical protein [Methanobacterium sp.]